MKRSLTLLIAVIALSFFISGCATNYWNHRYYDFRDMFDAEAGFSFSNPKDDILYPPSIGLLLETPNVFWPSKPLKFGYLVFNNTHTNGYSAGLELRGSWAGKEHREIYGFGPWYGYDIRQFGKMGPYKQQVNTGSGIDLYYGDDDADEFRMQAPMYRNSNYWEYLGTEMAISEPFLLHLGLKLRLGIDVCQIADFVLGWTTLDIYDDDMIPFTSESRMVTPETLE